MNLQSTLNEECGEISLAMLAQVQHRNQMMNVQHTTRAWKQCILRYNIAREWGFEFGHEGSRTACLILNPLRWRSGFLPWEVRVHLGTEVESLRAGQGSKYGVHGGGV